MISERRAADAAGGKPASKSGKTANDNQAPGPQGGTRPQPQPAAQPDPNLIAMAQATQIPAAPAQPQAAANDEGNDGEDTGAVSAAGKSGAKSASAAQNQADAPERQRCRSRFANPAAVAQAAIRGVGSNGNSNTPSGNCPTTASGNSATSTDKQAAKTADSQQHGASPAPAA